MDPVTGAILASSAINGAQAMASSASMGEANERTAAIAAANNEFNRVEAGRNRAWQTEMANTSYQRAMEDMRAAGLNPMLAYMKGGADTPSGSAASSSGNVQIQPKLPGNIASNAMQSMQLASTIDANKSQAALNTSLASKAVQDTATSAKTAAAQESASILSRAQAAKAMQESGLIDKYGDMKAGSEILGNILGIGSSAKSLMSAPKILKQYIPFPK